MKLRKALDGAIVFIIAVIIILFLNPILVNYLGVAGMAIAEAALAAVAIAVVLMRHEVISDRVNLRLPSIRSFFSALLLMVGAGMWENTAAYLYIVFFGAPANTDFAFIEKFFTNISPMAALVLIALIPAVCEELLFRGYLFDSFKGKKNSLWAIIISSVLFSVIHFDLYKLGPILIMALAFGYITAKTGSVLIPIIFHFINNSMALVSFYLIGSEGAQAVTPTISQGNYMWYAVASFGAGLVLVYFGSRLLSGKPGKKWKNIVVPIVSGVLFTVGIIGLVISIMSFAYNGVYSAQIREDTVYSETFVVNEDTVGFISASAMCSSDVAHSVVITDPSGEEVYNSNDPQDGNGIPLEKGEYSVIYSFDIPDGSSVAYDVAATAVVMTIGNYESASDDFGTV